MEKESKELLWDFVNSQHFTITTDIMNSSENTESGKSKNYRNGYSKKTVKTQIGEVDVKIPRDRNGEYEPKIMGKYSRNADGMEEKSLPCTPAV